MRKKVVVAEDDRAVRELLRAALEAQGWAVHAVEDGEQAVLACRWTRPNLLITDNQMPDMSGDELVRRVREDDRFERIRIIVFSADPKDTENVLADAVVPKAKGVEALLETVARLSKDH